MDIEFIRAIVLTWGTCAIVGLLLLSLHNRWETRKQEKQWAQMDREEATRSSR